MVGRLPRPAKSSAAPLPPDGPAGAPADLRERWRALVETLRTQGRKTRFYNTRFYNTRPYNTTCEPSSTTRFDGILKNAVALPALRNMATKIRLRQ